MNLYKIPNKSQEALLLLKKTLNFIKKGQIKKDSVITASGT